MHNFLIWYTKETHKDPMVKSDRVTLMHKWAKQLLQRFESADEHWKVHEIWMGVFETSQSNVAVWTIECMLCNYYKSHRKHLQNYSISQYICRIINVHKWWYDIFMIIYDTFSGRARSIGQEGWGWSVWALSTSI